LDPNELEDAVTGLEALVKKMDVKTEPGRNELLLRSRNLAAALLDPYILLHTRIVVKLTKDRGGDKIDEIAAWLHDIGRTVVGEGHREVGAIWARGWLKKFYITDDELERVLDGIKNHGTTSEPKTRTGKLLKLVDALAVFDEGWIAMMKKYAEVRGKPEILSEFGKKAAVIRELGTEDDIERMERVARAYGLEV